MLRVFGFWLVMTIVAVGSAVAQSGNIDPVGSYEFTTVTNNQTAMGKVTITKTETGWSAFTGRWVFGMESGDITGKRIGKNQ